MAIILGDIRFTYLALEPNIYHGAATSRSDIANQNTAVNSTKEKIGTCAPLCGDKPTRTRPLRKDQSVVSQKDIRKQGVLRVDRKTDL